MDIPVSRCEKRISEKAVKEEFRETVNSQSEGGVLEETKEYYLK